MEERNHPPGEFARPAQPQHMICLYLGQPAWLEQTRAGRTKADQVVKGHVQIVPAGEFSVWRTRSQSKHMHLLLEPALLGRIAEETADRDPDRVEIINHFSNLDPQIEYIGLALLDDLIKGRSSGRLYRESLTTALAAHLVQHYDLKPQTRPSVGTGLSPVNLGRAIDYIHQYLNQDIGLNDLAQQVGVSPHYFAGLFKQSTGQSPHQYIIEQRIEAARHLLQTTDMPITEVAAQVGFYDQSHLARHLRRQLGVSPKTLREDR